MTTSGSSPRFSQPPLARPPPQQTPEAPSSLILSRTSRPRHAAYAWRRASAAGFPCGSGSLAPCAPRTRRKQVITGGIMRQPQRSRDLLKASSIQHALGNRKKGTGKRGQIYFSPALSFFGLPWPRRAIRVPILAAIASRKRLEPVSWPRCTLSQMRGHASAGMASIKRLDNAGPARAHCVRALESWDRERARRQCPGQLSCGNSPTDTLPGVPPSWPARD